MTFSANIVIYWNILSPEPQLKSVMPFLQIYLDIFIYNNKHYGKHLNYRIASVSWWCWHQTIDEHELRHTHCTVKKNQNLFVLLGLGQCLDVKFLLVWCFSCLSSSSSPDNVALLLSHSFVVSADFNSKMCWPAYKALFWSWYSL